MLPDTEAFFRDLATEMNAHAEAYERFGDADFVAVIVMQRDGNDDFRVRMIFNGIRCEDVAEVDADDVALADFQLVGPLAAWREMFADIVANGRATGLQTINSLALMGDRIALRGTDPMGLDKFSRFNQSLQAFLDGAARVAPVGTS